MEECPICFERFKQSCILECSHCFCQDCLVKWITERRAFCPLCVQPVYGINTQGDTVYLSPHFGEFGFRYENRHGKFFVLGAEPGGLAIAHGVHTGYYEVNGSSDFEVCREMLVHALKALRFVSLARVRKKPGMVISCLCLRYEFSL